MAQKQVVITTLIDDLDGTEINEGRGETVKFALDGVNYEIDLGRANALRLRDALAPYIAKGRKGGRTSRTPRGSSRPRAARSTSTDLAAAREWLRANGHQVGDRGRIPAELMELYRSSK